VSSDWMYFTCGSMASWSSSGREEEPARPGPETSDILEGMLSFSSGIGSIEVNVVNEKGRNCDCLGVEMGPLTNFASQLEMPSASFDFGGCTRLKLLNLTFSAWIT